MQLLDMGASPRAITAFELVTPISAYLYVVRVGIRTFIILHIEALTVCTSSLPTVEVPLPQRYTCAQRASKRPCRDGGLVVLDGFNCAPIASAAGRRFLHAYIMGCLHGLNRGYGMISRSLLNTFCFHIAECLLARSDGL